MGCGPRGLRVTQCPRLRAWRSEGWLSFGGMTGRRYSHGRSKGEQGCDGNTGDTARRGRSERPEAEPVAGLVIYALRVGGGILALSQMPGRDGAYADDIAHLHEWQPALVITLATDQELEAHGAEDLGAELQSAGTRWAHLPVADMGVPSARITTQWPEVSAPALAALRGGGRVLVHCLGGCGRSGMAALRLMVEAGEKPDAALVRLRSLRPCAVETDEQLYWAMDTSEV